MGDHLSFPDTGWNGTTEEGLFQVLGWPSVGERGVNRACLRVWFPGCRAGHASWPWSLVQSLIFSAIKAKNYLNSTPRVHLSIQHGLNLQKMSSFIYHGYFQGEDSSLQAHVADSKLCPLRKPVPCDVSGPWWMHTQFQPLSTIPHIRGLCELTPVSLELHVRDPTSPDPHSLWEMGLVFIAAGGTPSCFFCVIW